MTQSEADGAFDAYILCTAPRSGSTMLCRMLRDAGAGNPDSWFHRPSTDAWAAAHGVERTVDTKDDHSYLRAIFEAAKQRGRGQGDIFGLRMQRHSFDYFTGRLRDLAPGLQGDKARMQATFGRTAFVHLVRTDKVAQAVSYVLATQTGLWHVNANGSELERTAPPARPTYDPAAIAEQVRLSQAADLAWQQWFNQQDINPLVVRYEALVAAPNAEVSRILTHLSLDTRPARALVPATGRMADTVNEDWIDRFRSA